MEEPVGYLHRTAMNLFRKRYRRAMLAIRKTVTDELRRDEFAMVEDRSIVASAMVELTPRQRAALVLTELIGFRSDEAGQMLNVSAGTVRALASQGRAAMKRHMEADGFGPTGRAGGMLNDDPGRLGGHVIGRAFGGTRRLGLPACRDRGLSDRGVRRPR